MIGHKLKVLRKRAHLSMKNVADKIGIAYQTYSKYEKGITKPNKKALSSLASFFNVSVAFLLSEEEMTITNNTERSFLSGKSKMTIRNAYEQYRYDVPEEYLETIDIEYIPLDWESEGDEFIVIKVNDSSMTPDLHRGDNAIVRLQNDFKSNDLVLIQSGTEPAVIRRGILKNESALFFSENKILQIPTLTPKDVTIIGVVVEVRRTFQNIKRK